MISARSQPVIAYEVAALIRVRRSVWILWPCCSSYPWEFLSSCRHIRGRHVSYASGTQASCWRDFLRAEGPVWLPCVPSPCRPDNKLTARRRATFSPTSEFGDDPGRYRYAGSAVYTLLITEVTVGSTCTDALISTRSHRLSSLHNVEIVSCQFTNITCEIRSV